jgi:hypothetical protein
MGSFVLRMTALYRVIDTERSDVQLLIPPYSLMVFLPPLYNQYSNEQGNLVEINPKKCYSLV